MESVLGLVTKEYEATNADLYQMLPTFKLKFRDQLCTTGAKYNYEDLSKVVLLRTNDSFAAIPYVFTPENDQQENTVLDYAGVYSIGILEILYMVLCKDEHQIGFMPMKISSALYKIINSYEDIAKLFKFIEQPEEHTGTLNIFYAMRTDYSRKGYKVLLKMVDSLMIAWYMDKKLYWQIFFEIMEYCKPILGIIMKDLYFDEDSEYGVNHYWLNDDKDLHFNAIRYAVPNSDNAKSITDCRGIAVFTVLQFYMHFINIHGYVCGKTSIYNADRLETVAYLVARFMGCLGEDNQAKVLQGLHIDEPALFDISNTYVYKSSSKQQMYTIGESKIARYKYEDLIMFSFAYISNYNSDAFINSADVNVNYSSRLSMMDAISMILYHVAEDLAAFDTSDLENQIKELTNSNHKLTTDINNLRAKLNDTISNDTHSTEVAKLQAELTEAKRIIESKNAIIDQINDENRDLNEFISNLYGDEESDNTELDEDELTIPIEEMTKFLNDFRFLMIGGRFDLLTKLADFGWTNVDQYDNCNRTMLQANQDFYVVNTKFTSHKVVKRVESLGVDDQLMYYNGTNPEKLIVACYKFVQAYLE